MEKEAPTPPVSELNKMTLLQFSYNNRYFLFHNRASEKLVVYELTNTTTANDPSFFGLDLKQIVAGAGTTSTWEFQYKYELKYDDSFLFDYLYGQDIDCLQYFCKNPSLIKVDNAAKVKICYCESFNPIEPDSDNSIADAERISVRLCGAIFSQDGTKSTSKCEGFNQMFEFPVEA